MDPLIEILLRGGRPHFVPHGFSCAPRIRPDVDIVVAEDEVNVLLDVAGTDAAQLSIVFDGPRLLIHGHRRDPRSLARGAYHLKEIQLGPFAVEIPLPVPVKGEGASASLENGLLEIRVPRLARAAPPPALRIDVALRRIGP